jgi:uncharacterized protein DUF5313
MTRTQRRRPTPFEWVWYAFGGRLSPRLHDWVRHDLTGRTWVARHISRALVQCAVPATLLVVLLPGPLGIRLGTAMLGVIVALYYLTTYVPQIIAGRLIKHGWPADLGQVTRAQRAAVAQRTADAAYGAAWRTQNNVSRRAFPSTTSPSDSLSEPSSHHSG